MQNVDHYGMLFQTYFCQKTLNSLVFTLLYVHQYGMKCLWHFYPEMKKGETKNPNTAH